MRKKMSAAFYEGVTRGGNNRGLEMGMCIISVLGHWEPGERHGVESEWRQWLEFFFPAIYAVPFFGLFSASAFHILSCFYLRSFFLAFAFRLFSRLSAFDK